MEIILIDEFIVPEESKAAFLEGTRKIQSFIRTLPGFVEGFLHEKKDGESRHNFLTTAVWENEEAFENAKRGRGHRTPKTRLQSPRNETKVEDRRCTVDLSKISLLSTDVIFGRGPEFS